MSGNFFTEGERYAMHQWRSDDPYFITHIKPTHEGMTFYWCTMFRWLDVKTGKEHFDVMYEDLSDNLEVFLDRWVKIHGHDNYAYYVMGLIKKERENEKNN